MMRTRNNRLTSTGLQRMSKRIMLLAFLFLAAQFSFSASIYYVDDFTTVNAGWTYNTDAAQPTTNRAVPIGRDGVLLPNKAGANASWVHIDTAGSNLKLRGRPNPADLSHNNYWVAEMALFDPFDSNAAMFPNGFEASKEQPFGFEIIRTFARIDPNDGNQTAVNYHQGALTVWLMEENGVGELTSGQWPSNIFSNFSNFVFIYDEMVATNALNTIGYFRGSKFPLASYTLQNNDYLMGANHTLNAHDFTTNFRLNYNTTDNNNALGIKMTHDGQRIRMYLNPDPNNTAIPSNNAWYLIKEVSASWNSNMKVGIGHEDLYFQTQQEDADYDNFNIRSVASSVSHEINIDKTSVNTNNINFEISINPTIIATDAGIGEIYIKKPAGLFSAWDTTTVEVESEWFDSANNGTIGSLTREADGDANPTATNAFKCSVSVDDPNVLKIRLRKGTALNGVIGNSVLNKEIKVRFTLDTTATPESDGAEMEVYLHNEKYRDTPISIIYNAAGIPYATTAAMKSVGGNATIAYATDTATVKIFSEPTAFASVSHTPNPLFEGNAETFFAYEISTIGISDAPNLTRFEILIPTGFTLDMTSIDSLLLNVVEEGLAFSTTSSPAGTILVIDYDAAGRFISGDNGIDRITFRTTAVPTLGVGINFTDYIFDSTVDSIGFLSTSNPNATQTNASFPTQTVRVVKDNANLECHVFPNIIGNDAPLNSFTYTFTNRGPTGNDVKQVRVDIPKSRFNGAAPVIGGASTGGGTITTSQDASYHYFTITYGGTLAGGANNSDSITFDLTHDIPQVPGSPGIDQPAESYDFICAADNQNTLGLQPGIEEPVLTWAVQTVPPQPSGASYVVNGSDATAYTTDTTYTLDNYIYNTGAVGNNITFAEVLVPKTVFAAMPTNISSNLVSAGFISVASDASYWRIQVDYSGAGTSILSIYQGGSTPDVISFDVADNITSPSSYDILTMVGNASPNPDTQTTVYQAPLNSQTVTVNWAPVNARGYFDPSPNPISASNTSTVVTAKIDNLAPNGNIISYVYLNFPVGITGITPISSSLVTTGAFSFNPGTRILTIDYTGVTFNGTMSDTIQLTMDDNVLISDIPNGQNDLLKFVTFQVQNQLETVSVLPLAPFNQELQFNVPAPIADGNIYPSIIFKSTNSPTTDYTQSMSFELNNNGSVTNALTKAVIKIPTMFQGKIAGGTLASASGAVVSDGTSIVVTYGTPLSANDSITFDLTIDNTTNLSTAQDWDLTVSNRANGSSLTEINQTSGADATQNSYMVTQPTFTVSPSTVLTSQNTNTFTIDVFNGQTGEREVKNLVIRMPNQAASPVYFDGATIVSITNLLAANRSSIATNGGQVVIDYAGVGFQLNPGQTDRVEFTINDLVSDPATVNVTVQVDYGELGFYEFRNAAPKTANSDEIRFTPADSDVYAWTTPNDVPHIYTDATYTLTIQNNATSSSNVVKYALIEVPDVITSITSVASSILTNDAAIEVLFDATLNKWMIHLKYEDYEATSIPDSSADVITIVATDNVTTSGIQKFWRIYAANSNQAGDLKATGNEGIIGKSRRLKFIDAPFLANFSVSPNSIPATNDTTNMTLTLSNVSVTGAPGEHEITKAEVTFPPAFNVGSITSFTSTRGGSITGTAGNTITITYPAGFAPTLADTITFSIDDTFYNALPGAQEGVGGTLGVGYTTGQSITTSVVFTTSNNILIPCNVFPSSANQANFVQPEANANANITNFTLSILENATDVVLNLNNLGTQDHTLYEAKIVINHSGITSISNIQSSLITNPANIIYNQTGSTFTILLQYFNEDIYFPAAAGNRDVITFTVTDSITDVTDVPVLVYVNNNNGTTNINDTFPFSGGKQLTPLPGQTLTLKYRPPLEDSEGYIEIAADESVIDITNPIVVSQIINKDTIYTILSNGSLTTAILRYTVKNISSLNDIEQLEIGWDQSVLDWMNPSDYSVVSVESSQISACDSGVTNLLVPTPTVAQTDKFYIDYTSYGSSGCSIPRGESETITIRFTYNLKDILSNSIIDMYGKVWYTGSPIVKDLVPAGNSQTLHINVAQFGRITGRIYPNGTNYDFNVKVITDVISKSVPINFEGVETPIVAVRDDGTYIIDFVNPGRYFLRAIDSSAGYPTQTVNDGVLTNNPVEVQVKKREITVVADYEMQNKTFSPTDGLTLISDPQDPLTVLRIPTSRIVDKQYIDIRGEYMNAQAHALTAQQVTAQKNALIAKSNNEASCNIMDANTVFVYNIVSQMTIDGEKVPLVENNILTANDKEPVTLNLHYTDADLLAQGWVESNLSVHYWNYARSEWMPLGGSVDASNNVITVTVNNLHRTYTVLGCQVNTNGRMISNIQVFPKIFSPGIKSKSSDTDVTTNNYNNSDTYGILKINFYLTDSNNQPATSGSYTLTIFDFKGNIMYRWDDMPIVNPQNGISWDGRDRTNAIISSGVYIYQIKYNGQLFTGTFAVLR